MFNAFLVIPLNVILLTAIGVIALWALFGNSSSPLIGGNIPVSNVISHWSHFFQTFAISSDSFYKEVEAMIQKHEMPHSLIKRTTHNEGSILSAKREYLRIQHGDIVFDVCAAPFGKDFFVSWWLYETESPMRRLFKSTKFGDFLKMRAQKRTFFQIDEEDMFRSCVHECILDTVAKVGETQGYRQLTDRDKAFTMGGL